MNIIEYGKRARAASYTLASIASEQKNKALLTMAALLRENSAAIISANQKDLTAAKQNNLSTALIDRLTLNTARIEAMAAGIENIAQLADPIGHLLEEIKRPNDLLIRKIRVPLGVIAMIYEARPNVTADVAALCLKTSNAVILRGGSDALHSNLAIVELLKQALIKNKLPEDAIQLITTTDRNAVRELVQMTQYIDLVIPRGGESLINMVTAAATVPVIKHYKGVCHVFIDENADLQKALQISENAKCQRPGVCNAMETLLVHKNIAEKFLPALAQQLTKYPVELRGDELARKIIPSMLAANEKDWETEYLDYILSVKIVTDTNGAINHINTFGSHHSDAIVSENKNSQQQFLQQVDSAVVYVNASTRFTDGSEFGMGAEIGISTDKLHARGPMGLAELTTYKYQVLGSGQIRN